MNSSEASKNSPECEFQDNIDNANSFSVK